MSRDGTDQRLFVDLLRGVCGGCVFAMPLLYTMEMWWLGYDDATTQTVLCVGAAFVLCTALNAFAFGYRDVAGLLADAGDALVSVAVGIVLSTVLLAAVGEIRPSSSVIVALRQAMLLAIPVSVGIALSRSQLANQGKDVDDDPEGYPSDRVILHRLGVAVAGALVLGMGAAPTEEIRMIALRIGWFHLLCLTGLSLAITWGTVFVADFSGQRQRVVGRSPVGETLLMHAIGLLVAALLLYAYGFLDGSPAAPEATAVVVVLGLPTTVGAAVGRLTL